MIIWYVLAANPYTDLGPGFYANHADPAKEAQRLIQTPSVFWHGCDTFTALSGKRKGLLRPTVTRKCLQGGQKGTNPRTAALSAAVRARASTAVLCVTIWSVDKTEYWDLSPRYKYFLPCVNIGLN